MLCINIHFIGLLVYEIRAINFYHMGVALMIVDTIIVVVRLK